MAIIYTKYINKHTKIDYEIIGYIEESELFHRVLVKNRSTTNLFAECYPKMRSVKSPAGGIINEPCPQPAWMEKIKAQPHVDEFEYMYKWMQEKQNEKEQENDNR